MPAPLEPVTLAPKDIQEVERLLADLRHNINNDLSLIIAAIELMQRKPEISPRMVDTIAVQPAKILNELRGFSDRIEAMLHIVREPKP
jgi:hypothetical protein